MSQTRKPPAVLRINPRSRNSIKKSGPVRISEAPSDPQAPAARMADRLVIACRENVRFLNFHLQRFDEFLEIPALADNALYLAYTVRVRENAPFDAATLRRHLADAGIETIPAFSFTAPPEADYDGPAANRINRPKREAKADDRAFCLGCHQYLTILDLQHIVASFETIFKRYTEIARLTSTDPTGRRDC